MIKPPSIGKGDDISVVAPAGPVKREELDLGLHTIEPRYRVHMSEGLFSAEGYLAGSDERRRRELQEAIDNRRIKAILAARGGFGTTRIIDLLNLDALASKPKWLAGCSDFTAVLMKVWADFRLLSIHGPMVAALGRCDPNDLASLTDLLEGRPWTPPPNLVALFPGRAKGPLIGGNLTVLAHMCGSLDPSAFDRSILFIEDVGEKPYRLDRCLVQLDRSGILRRISGAVIGEFTDCTASSDGVTAEIAVADNLNRLGVPAAYGYPAAHGKRNYPFVHGAEVELNVSSAKASLRQI